MTTKIQLEGMRFYAYHGYYDHEQQRGNDFVVDVELELVVKDEHLKSDDLKVTLNYEQVYELVKQEMAIKSRLLENVCYRIKTRIQNTFSPILNVRVAVAKLHPPLNGEVTLVRVTL